MSDTVGTIIGFTLIGLLIFLLIYGIKRVIRGNNVSKKQKEKLLASGIDPAKFIFVGKYLGGLTDITKQYKRIHFYPTVDGYDLYSETTKIGKLPGHEIRGIICEDKSSVEKRMSVTSIALFGVLGLAMRKSKKLDVALLIIKTFDGRFESEGIFLFESKNGISVGKCFGKANEVRSKLINHLKTVPVS